MTETSNENDQPKKPAAPMTISSPQVGTGGATAGDQAVANDDRPPGRAGAGGIATSLQPGGMRPGGGPGAGLGSIGTGGGNTANSDTGSQGQDGH